MAITKEWRCMAHGPFESAEARCPRGCTTVERAFYTAPGHIGGGTKGMDRTLKTLASDFGMTDMNNRGGRAARQYEQHPNAPRFGQMPKGKKGENAIAGALAALQTEGMRQNSAIVESTGLSMTNALHGTPVAKKPAYLARRDPQNLKIA